VIDKDSYMEITEEAYNFYKSKEVSNSIEDLPSNMSLIIFEKRASSTDSKYIAIKSTLSDYIFLYSRMYSDGQNIERFYLNKFI
jgi:hypothetical protein